MVPVLIFISFFLVANIKNFIIPVNTYGFIHIDFVRDFFLTFILIFSIFRIKKLNLDFYVFLFFSFLMFLAILIKGKFELDYIHHFLRNLFFYPISALVIFNAFKMSTDKIIYSSIFISILGFVAQYLGWISIPDIGSRYYGLFLSPQSAALIDFFTLAYLIKLRFTSRLYISLSFIMFFLILKTECVPVIVIATIYIIYNIYKFKITFYQYLIAIVIEGKNIFGRIVKIINIEDSRTITGRLESWKTITSPPKSGEVFPLDSSYLFTYKYLGFTGLIIFLAFLFYIYARIYNLYATNYSSEDIKLELKLLLSFFSLLLALSFIYNPQYSFSISILIFTYYAALNRESNFKSLL